MYKRCIRVIHVVNSKLYVDFLMRIKYVWFELDDFTLIFCPRGNVLKFVPSFLEWKTCESTKMNDYFEFNLSYFGEHALLPFSRYKQEFWNQELV